MTRDDVVALGKTLQYKPGWTITLDTADQWMHFFGYSACPGCVQVSITFKAPDAGYPDPTRAPIIDIVMREIVDGVDHMEREMFVHILFRLLLKCEEHEAGEWFKVNGQRPFDPHRGGQ